MNRLHSHRLHNLQLLLAALPRTFRLIWSAASRWTTAWVILLVIQGLLPASTVYLTGLLIDSLVQAIDAGGSWQALRPTLILAAIMGGILLLIEILRGIAEWVRTAQAEYVRDYIQKLIHEKSTAVDLAFYESPDYHDRLSRVKSDATGRPLSLLENSGNLLQNAITLLAMAAILIPYGIWLPFVLLISTLPAFTVVLHHNRKYHRWWQEVTADRRWLQYFDAILTGSGVAAELRLFNLGSHFRQAYQSLRQRLRHEELDLTRQKTRATLAASALTVLISGLAVAWMAWRTIQGLVTLGDLARFYQAFNQGQSLLRSLLRNIGQIYSNALFLNNLFEFLALSPDIADPEEPHSLPVPLSQGITFQQVSFTYPGSEKPVLSKFNLTLPAGKIVAIVGMNGAGKTTLTKLICRFYDPQHGRITLDGLDLRQFAVGELRRHISVLFQIPVPYHATVAENIRLGDLSRATTPAVLQTAARHAGAHDFISQLPAAYDTLLGKWFADGVELSGGQWQRLALARAFYKDAHIVILDEPTNHMDSWSELDWLARFRQLVHGRTALIITHRFTTAMQADIIHVMDAGRIIESGSHAELLAQNGRYAQSWRAQMQGAAHRDDQPNDHLYDEIQPNGRGHRQPAATGRPQE